MIKEIRKHPLTIKGKYYVDKDNCFWCAICVETATSNFALNADDVELGAYVFKQPETIEEENVCNEATVSCPHEAVHNDGE